MAAAAVLLRPAPAAALTGSPGSGDGTLFALTNQDRASNGRPSLAYSAALAGVGQSRPYYACNPSPIYGRAADMIQRDYFSHVIPGCGTYVWPMMTAAGVHWSSAGENIGWVSGYDASQGTASAQWVNNAFMNSAPHRANILGDYNQLGVGSWFTVGPWSYPGSATYHNVYMYAEEFALVHASPPPPKPTPRPTARPTPQPTRNAPAPTPQIPAAHTTKPRPQQRPSPLVTPTPTPTPAPPPRGVAAVPLTPAQGLLASTVDGVISGYLDE